MEWGGREIHGRLYSKERMEQIAETLSIKS
jgi:hypothetical protein